MEGIINLLIGDRKSGLQLVDDVTRQVVQRVMTEVEVSGKKVKVSGTVTIDLTLEVQK